MKKTIVGLLFVLLSSAAFALPTLQQVEAEVKQGNYTQAETMMSEVVAAKPGSAKAHYIYAEILAHNASFAKASEEAAKAQQIDPKVTFADPDRFRAFQQTLQRELNPPARTRAAPVAPVASTPAFAPAASGISAPERTGIPGWVWLAGLIVLGLVMWRMFARGRDAVPGSNFAPAGMAPSGGFQPGGGMNAGTPYGNNGVQQPGAGSGLLKTGLAVGAGVAGGMLIDEMLHRRSDGSNNTAGTLGGFDPNGYNPAADSAARELENRPIDFGQGDDWDSGGGSVDSGGGSDGGGGWD